MSPAPPTSEPVVPECIVFIQQDRLLNNSGEVVRQMAVAVPSQPPRPSMQGRFIIQNDGRPYLVQESCPKAPYERNLMRSLTTILQSVSNSAVVSH